MHELKTLVGQVAPAVSAGLGEAGRGAMGCACRLASSSGPHRHPHNTRAFAYAHAHTPLTPRLCATPQESLERAHGTLRMFDTNEDGRVSADEFLGVFEFLGQDMDDAEFQVRRGLGSGGGCSISPY